MSEMGGVQCYIDTHSTVQHHVMEFIRDYAVANEFFTGGDLLAAYRNSQLPGYTLNWRNKWGARVLEGSRRGWYRKSGKVEPNTKQSHTDKLVLWQSRIYEGTQSLAGQTIADQLEDIRKRFAFREIDIKKALWLAYELGNHS